MGIFNVTRTGVGGLMYEVKSTSKNPPPKTAIAASNRKDRIEFTECTGCTEFPLYRVDPVVLSIPSVLSVPNLP